MANTWNGMTFTNIAQVGFSAFMKGLAPLGVFTTDFSATVASQGTKFETRIVPASDAAVDMSDAGNLTGSVAYNREDSAIIKDITTTKVSGTLDTAPATGFLLEDQIADEISSGVWADTSRRLVEQKAYAVAKSVVQAAINTLIPATYTNTAAYTGSAANFDMDEVVDAAEAVAQLGWDSNSPTYMVLDTAYGAALKKDNAIQDLSASGIAVVQSGDLTKLDRFSILESPIIRDCATFYGAANYGRGFVCKPTAQVICMRPIKSQAPERLEHYEVMTDPESGASLVYRVHYAPATGNMYHVFETLYGLGDSGFEGQVDALSLIVSQ